MFNFFKKKPKTNTTHQPIIVLSDNEIAELKTVLAEKQQQLSVLLEQNQPNTMIIAKHYEDMGLIASKIDQDQAIDYLENSLSYQLTIDDGYKQLISLYNQKRAQAAQNGDSNGIDKWMNKMDDMRQIAKKVITTR